MYTKLTTLVTCTCTVATVTSTSTTRLDPSSKVPGCSLAAGVLAARESEGTTLDPPGDTVDCRRHLMQGGLRAVEPTHMHNNARREAGGELCLTQKSTRRAYAHRRPLTTRRLNAD